MSETFKSRASGNFVDPIRHKNENLCQALEYLTALKLSRWGEGTWISLAKTAHYAN